MKIMKKVLSLIVIMILLLLNTNVKAASLSGNFSVKANSTNVKAGDTIKIDVTLNDLVLQEGTYGITQIKTNIEYNKDIFETIKKSDIDVGDKDATVRYIDTNKLISIEFDTPDTFIKESGKIFTLTLKVKDNASFTNTEVKLLDLQATDNNSNIKETKALTFNYAGTINNNQNENQQQEQGQQEQQEQEQQENSNKQEETKNKEKKDVKDSTTSKGKLPKTGLNEIIALIAMYSVIVLTVMFIRNRQINK